MKPEFFKDDIYKMNLSVNDLKRGYLNIDDKGETIINLPMIDNEELYNKNIYDTWKSVKI